MTRSPASFFTVIDALLLPDNTKLLPGPHVECPCCRGSGETDQITSVRDLPNGMRVVQFGVAVCDVCNGSRVLPLEAQA